MRTIYISGNLNKILKKICAFRFLTSGDDFWRSNAGRNIWPVGFECLWLLLATVHYLKAFFRNSSQVIWGLDIYSNKDICFSKPQWAGFLSKSDRWAQRQIKKRTKKKPHRHDSCFTCYFILNSLYLFHYTFTWIIIILNHSFLINQRL